MIKEIIDVAYQYADEVWFADVWCLYEFKVCPYHHADLIPMFYFTALDALQGETASVAGSPAPEPSGRYANDTSPTDAVRKYLQENPDKEFTSTDVMHGILDGKYGGNTKGLVATVYGVLKRLTKQGKVIRTQSSKGTWLFKHNEGGDGL